MNQNPVKKILFLLEVSPSQGAQRYVYDIVTHLDREQYQPMVLTYQKNSLITQLSHAEIPVIYVTNTSQTTSWHDLANVLKHEAPDILHIVGNKPYSFATLIARRYFIRRIIFTPFGLINQPGSYWQKIKTKLYSWASAQLAHTTIAVSRTALQQFASLKAGKKCTLIHPARNIGVMYTHQEARDVLVKIIPQLQICSSNQYTWLVSITELRADRQIETVLRSVKSLLVHNPKLRYIIIGDGAEQNKLNQLITELKLTNHVFLSGFIPDAARLLHAFNYFILPTKTEAYCYAVHEAGLARLPVISSDRGGIRDIVIHNKSGLLLNKVTTETITDVLQSLISDRTKTESLRHHLQQSMKNRSFTKMMSATTNTYHYPN